MAKDPLYSLNPASDEIALHSSTALPAATGYLWNSQMLLNMSCQGYANVHFMQPEPATYTSGPALEAKTFLQPEHQYYPGHPGRFFYFNDKNSYFSAPYAPVKRVADAFVFTISSEKITWQIKQGPWQIDLEVMLAGDEVAEVWSLTIKNLVDQPHTLQVWPCFNIGNQSWMNQSADFDSTLNAIVADKVTPYQKTADYLKQRRFKEKTFFASSQVPDSWTTSLADFLGEGDWQYPQSLDQQRLNQAPAIYCSPVACMQFELAFEPQQSKSFTFVFGAAKSNSDIQSLLDRFCNEQGVVENKRRIAANQLKWRDAFTLTSPDRDFNHFVNHWLTRQVYYHGETNRLTTDPQTRNYLQDGMGMCFVEPSKMREALLTTLSQQSVDGEIPDGVLLHPDAELKYINQVPHTDHAAWVPICLKVYLDETNDFAMLDEVLPFADSSETATVWEHIQRAMTSLQINLDSRGLSLISQGDWCDPMNMVGHLGKGVSSWLSMATSWSFQQWSQICHDFDKRKASDYWHQMAIKLNAKINDYFWQEQWYARGITDRGRTFGTALDTEGRIFLNPQSWAMLCGAADSKKMPQLQQAVSEQLMTQFGPQMLAPAYTHMHEDVGRLTQKFPGVAENGAIYCHAAAFYIYALAKQGQIDTALAILKMLIPDEGSCEQRGQLPNYIPNYYRGAAQLYPSECGRSSRLFNTGTVAWLMRTIIEGICGFQGHKDGLKIEPKLPTSWDKLSVNRRFRSHQIHLDIRRGDHRGGSIVSMEGRTIRDNTLTLPHSSSNLHIDVVLPKGAP